MAARHGGEFFGEPRSIPRLSAFQPRSGCDVRTWGTGDRGSPIASRSPSVTSILIVDDELLIRWAIAETLAADGFRVLEAGSAREALQMLENGGEVGVVVLDLKLPDSSDLGLLRTMRQRVPRLPIIVMTAHATAELREEAVRAGAILALDKPFDMHFMADRIREAIAA
jgi:two-component system, NtrC family, response regulator GlrR